MAKTGTSPIKLVAAKKAKSPSTKKGRRGGGKEEPAGNRIMKAIASQRAFGIEDANRSTIQGLAAMPNKKSFDTTLLNMKKRAKSRTTPTR